MLENAKSARVQIIATEVTYIISTTIMSSLDSFIFRLSELAKDKQKKTLLVRLCDNLKKLPETPDPADRFKDNHELLMNIFMSAAEFVKMSNVNQIVGSLKLIKLLVPYLEAAK